MSVAVMNIDKWNIGEYWDGEHIDDLETQALKEYCETHYLCHNKCVCGEHSGQGISPTDVADIDDFYAWENAFIRGDLIGRDANEHL